MNTISVVIAAFRAERWLKECIDSVLNQNLPNDWRVEILLGVDGCDKTLKVARSIQHASLKKLSLKSNYGTYVTFNTLMKYAQGDLICRFDADDVMKPNYFIAQIPYHTDGYHMTQTWSIYTDIDLNPTSHVIAHEVYHPKGGLNRKGADGQFIINRGVWDKLGGFRPWRCGADTDFFRRLRHAEFKHCVVEEFLYYRRTHHGSLTAHPKTNFSSSLRHKLQALSEKYHEGYADGSQALHVKAECAPYYDYI